MKLMRSVVVIISVCLMTLAAPLLPMQGGSQAGTSKKKSLMGGFFSGAQKSLQKMQRGIKKTTGSIYTGASKQYEGFKSAVTTKGVSDFYQKQKSKVADYRQKIGQGLTKKYGTIKEKIGAAGTQQPPASNNPAQKTAPTLQEQLLLKKQQLKKTDQSKLEQAEQQRLEKMKEAYKTQKTAQPYGKPLSKIPTQKKPDSQNPQPQEGQAPPRFTPGMSHGMVGMGMIGMGVGRLTDEEIKEKAEQVTSEETPEVAETETSESEPTQESEPKESLVLPVEEEVEEELYPEPEEQQEASQEQEQEQQEEETQQAETVAAGSSLSIVANAVKLIPAILKEIPNAIKNTLNTITYDQSELKLAISFMNPLTKKQEEIGIKYVFGFAGAGDPSTGFSNAQMEILPEFLLGTIPTRKLLLGRKDPITGKRTDLASKVLTLLPPELQRRMEKVLDHILEPAGDVVFVFKTFMLLNSARINVQSRVMSLPDAALYIGSEIPFLLARLTQTVDEEATRDARDAAKKEGKDPAQVQPIMFSPRTIYNRFKDVMPEIASIIDAINQSIKFPMPAAEYDEYRLRLAPGAPSTPLEETVVQVRDTAFIQGYLNRVGAATDDLLVQAAPSIDVVDQRLFVKAILAFVRELNVGVDADDASELSKQERDEERRTVLSLRIRALQKLLRGALAQMKQAGFKSVFMQPIQEALNALNVTNPLTLFDRDLKFEIKEDPTFMTLFDIIDMRYAQFIKHIVQVKVEGEPGYVDFNFPVNDLKAIERIFALGFWALKHSKQARSAYVRDDAGARQVYVQKVQPLQKELQDLQGKIRSATSAEARQMLLIQFKKLSAEYKQYVRDLTKGALTHVYVMYPPTIYEFEGEEISSGGLKASIASVLLKESVRVFMRARDGLIGQLKGVFNKILESALGISLADVFSDDQIEAQEAEIEDLIGDDNFDDFEAIEEEQEEHGMVAA